MTVSDYEPLDRRPIRARSSRWAALTTRWLVRTGLSPNAISVMGMAAAIVAGLLIGATCFLDGGAAERVFWLAGVALVQFRLLCNLLDGMVAVESGSASPIGELYNEVPDRVADVAVLVGLGYAAGGSVTLGYIAAVIAVFVAYVRAMAKASGAPNDFSGPMAKPHRMFAVTVVGLYLALAPIAWRFNWGPDGAWGVVAVALLVIIVGGIATATRRLRFAARALHRA